MKVSVPPVAPPTPPETGASSVSMPAAAPASCAFLALSTSMVELSMSSAPFGAAGRRSPQAASTCAPGRQHGDDDLGPRDRLARAAHDRDAGLGRGLLLRLDEVVAGDPVAGLDQVGGHRPAHVAQPQKCDVGHFSSLPNSGAPTGPYFQSASRTASP